MKIKIVVSLLAATALLGCANEPVATNTAKQDGDIILPTSYKSWPVFISDIDKEAGKQVRDIYINTSGTKIAKGQDFPDGTQFVMELYKAKENVDGTLVKQPDGTLSKESLTKIFVMEKAQGSGKIAPEGLANGDWVYAAYNADGSIAEVDYNTCRGCHLANVANKDFVFHYDQYFDM